MLGIELIKMKLFSIKSLLIIAALAILLAEAINSCSYLWEDLPDDLELTRVFITRVIDGDTAYARFPDGSKERVRFIGVDSPETDHPVKGNEPYGREAEEYTRSQIEGIYLWLETDVGERDQYGRILAYLWLSIPKEINDGEMRNKMFNARLLLEGYAVQVIFQPNVKYVDYFAVYESEARDSRRGLWGISDNDQ